MARPGVRSGRAGEVAVACPPDHSVVLAVGLQDRVIREVEGGEGVVTAAQLLLNAALRLGRRTILAEIELDELGETPAALTPYAQATLRVEGFDATRSQRFGELVPPSVTEVLLLGMEAQSSILQTGLSLLKMGKTVLVAADAVGARRTFEKHVALSRLAQKGAEIVSVEMIIYEWLASRSAQDIASITLLMRRHGTAGAGQADRGGPPTPGILPLQGIGPQLRRSRALRGMTLKQLALHCHCSSGQLSKIENNKALPSLTLLQRLSEVLGRDMTSLLGD